MTSQVGSRRLPTPWPGLLLAAVLLLPGCGADEPRAGAPRAEPSSETPAGAPSPAPMTCVPGVDSVPGVGAVGQEQAMAAYCLLVDLALEQGFTRWVLPGAAGEPRDFAGVRPALTGAARARWDAAVDAWLDRRDPSAGRFLDGLVLHDVTDVPAGYRIDPDGPYAYGTQAGAPTARVVAGGDALELRFVVESGLVLEREGDDSGRHSLLPLERRGTYVMVPEGAGWRLDRWRATVRYGEVRLVSAG